MSVASDGHGLKLEKIGPTFSSSYLYRNILWIKVLIDDLPIVKLCANGPGGLPYERGVDAPRKF